MAFTLRAAIVGSILGAVLSLSLSYFALSLGWVFLPILLTSIFCTAILRSVLQKTTIHEIALAQTVAGTAALVSAASAFVFPALLLSQPGLGFFRIFLIILTSGLLGVVLSYTFHDQIIRHGRFIFSDGQEASLALRHGDLHAVRSKLIAGFFALGGLFSLLKLRFSLPFFLNLRSFGISSGFSFGACLSAVPFAGGYLLGLVPAVSWFAGSVLSYLVVVPFLLYLNIFELKAVAISQATSILGLGAVLGCAIGYFLMRSGPELRALFKPKLQTGKKYSFDFFKDLSTKKRLWQAFFLSFAILALSSGISVFLSFFAVLFSLFAFYLACVASGKDYLGFFEVFPFFFVFLAKILFSSLSIGLVFFAGFIAVCSASAIAFTHNFRAGKVIGTKPSQQLIAQAVGVFVAAVLAWLIFSSLSSFFALGSVFLPAPHPVLLDYFISNGFAETPFVIGLFIGLILTIAFFKMNLGFLTLPFALGLFMPIEVGFTLLLGGVFRHIIDSRNKGIEKARLSVSSFALGEAFALAFAAVYYFLL